jgi:hypothetical protein
LIHEAACTELNRVGATRGPQSPNAVRHAKASGNRDAAGSDPRPDGYYSTVTVCPTLGELEKRGIAVVSPIDPIRSAVRRPVRRGIEIPGSTLGPNSSTGCAIIDKRACLSEAATSAHKARKQQSSQNRFAPLGRIDGGLHLVVLWVFFINEDGLECCMSFLGTFLNVFFGKRFSWFCGGERTRDSVSS